MRSWIDFWNGDNAVYVNERHKARNAERIGRDICRHIPRPDAVVLDFGCGEALYAEEVKRHCGRLILCDAAETIRAGLAARLANYPGIDVVTPDDLPRLPDATFDLIVVNSVIQYIGKDQLGGHLDLWRTKLKPDGRLVVADVIPPGVSPMTDALALLHFAWSGGFLWGALTGLVRTALSDYGRIRKELGFSMYSEVEFIALLARHGFAAERVHPNFCHNQARMTFSARNMSP
jgi:SAM-dependent methyltransferase